MRWNSLCMVIAVSLNASKRSDQVYRLIMHPVQPDHMSNYEESLIANKPKMANIHFVAARLLSS